MTCESNTFYETFQTGYVSLNFGGIGMAEIFKIQNFNPVRQVLNQLCLYLFIFLSEEDGN